MGRPKALLTFQGETFVDRLVRAMQPVCDEIIVVLGYHAEVIRRGIASNPTFVVNPEPERGQLSSLQAALAVLPEQADGFLFLPVDCPAVKASTVRAVAEAGQGRLASTLLVIPRMGDRRGHPVFASRPIAAELLALPPTGQARDVVHAHRAETAYLDVGDPGIFSDIDDPEAYRKLMESQG